MNTQWHNLQNQHVSSFNSSNLNNPFSSLEGCTCPADVAKLEADEGEVSLGRYFCPGCMMCSFYCVEINWHTDFLWLLYLNCNFENRSACSLIVRDT